MKTLLSRIVPAVILMALPAAVLAAGKAAEVAYSCCCPLCCH